MNIFGIDTTTKIASCSVLNNEKYYIKSIDNEITHSEKLLPIIDETLIESGTDLDGINILACINGPGSFTGLRIGLATIKAFAQVKDLPIFSISSIDLITYTAYKKLEENNESYILSLIDARNNRVYYGINKLSFKDNKVLIEKIKDIDNDTLDNVVSIIKDNYKDLIIAGNCIDKFKDTLSPISSKLLNIYPTTNDLINCYLNLVDTSKYMYNAYSLDALYARKSQAERMSDHE